MLLWKGCKGEKQDSYQRDKNEHFGCQFIATGLVQRSGEDRQVWQIWGDGGLCQDNSC